MLRKGNGKFNGGTITYISKISKTTFPFSEFPEPEKNENTFTISRTTFQQKEIKQSQTQKKQPPVIHHNRSATELLISIALNLLINNLSSPETRKKVIKYLKNLPEDFLDAYETPIKTLTKILIETGNELCENFENISPNEIYKRIISKVANASVENKLKASYFANLLLLAQHDALITFPTFQQLYMELIQEWKNRKINLIQQFLSHERLTPDQLYTFLQELIEVQNFSPFPEDREKSEEEMLLSMACRPEDLDVEVSYLYDEFLPTGTINFWVAPPSQGKSALALALSCWLLDQGKVDKVLYFDGDNPLTVLKQRKLDAILSRYKNKLFYFLPNSATEFQQLVFKSSSVKGKVLIIIDTLRAFVGSQDINKGEIAEKIMTFFKDITRTGNKTVIVLHHVNKPPRDSTTYTLLDRIKGATEFRDRADVIFFFTKRNQDENALYVALENLKPRMPVKNKIYFKINIPEAKMEEIDEILTKEEQEFVSAVINCIYEYSRMRGKYPNKKQLEQYLRDKYNFGRNLIRNWLDRFTGKYWRQTYDSLYNQIIFKPVCKTGKNENKRQTGEVGNSANFSKHWPEIKEDLTPEQKRVVETWGDNNTEPAAHCERKKNEKCDKVKQNNSVNKNSSPLQKKWNVRRFSSSENSENKEVRQFASLPVCRTSQDKNQTNPPTQSDQPQKAEQNNKEEEIAIPQKEHEDDWGIEDLPDEILATCYYGMEDKLPEEIQERIKKWKIKRMEFVRNVLGE
jgi:hypothetical protein